MSVFKDIAYLKASGYDPASIEEAAEWNARWERFLASPIGPFLDNGDPEKLWQHSDTPKLDLATIARNVQELVPDAVLFRFDFLPVWTSPGGNVIAYHPATGTFYWADHDCVFGFESVLLPVTYEELPLTADNLMKTLIPLTDEACGLYLLNLRDGKYDAKIDGLD